MLDLGRDGRGSGKAVVFTESITTQEYLRRLLLEMGLGDEDVDALSRLERSRAREPGACPLARGGRPHVRAWRQADARGGGAARPRSRVPHAFEDPGLHGGRREGPEPPVLRDGHQLRPAVEPAANRAAHRPLPPLQPAARRHGRQLHRPRQRSPSSDLRDPQPEARPLRQGARRVGPGAARAANGCARDGRVGAWRSSSKTDLRNIYGRSRTLDEVTREIASLRDKIGDRRNAYEKEYQRTSQIIESRFDEDVRHGLPTPPR